MKRILLTAAASLIAASAAFASDHEAGNAADGEKDFKKCKACHSIIDDEGEKIVKGGKTGPNLWGVIGRTAGTADGFRYGASIVAAGEAGLVWDVEQLLAYITDPKTYLREYLDDSSAKSKMTFKMRDGLDVATFLATFSPEMEEEATPSE